MSAAATTIQTHTLDTPRMSFHYRTHGDLSGIPMLLIHGSYATSRWWEPFMALLPDEVYAIAPDLRGCGASTKSAAGYTIEEQAEDVWSFVETLGLREFDLVGHSSGGAIAVELALAHRHAASTLILVDSVPVEGVFTSGEVILLLEEMQRERVLLKQGLLLMGLDRGTALDDYTKNNADAKQFIEQLVDDAAQMAPALFTAIAESLGRWNRFAEARYLTLPSLIIWGDQDQIVDREAMTRTLLAVPGANNLQVLRGVGHSPMIEAPLVLAECIIDFVTEDFQGYQSIREQIDDD